MSVLRARDVSFAYVPDRPVLYQVSIAIARGEIVGLTGASGGGKSTLGQILAGHRRPDAGVVTLEGEAGRRAGPQRVQYLFQAPETAVNPRWTIERILTEAWKPDAALRQAFGISPAWSRSYPHELSGGELQRVTILRALAPDVQFLVADEVTAMLDALTQAQIWRALLAVATERRLGLLVLSHDLALLERVCVRSYELTDGRLLPFRQGKGCTTTQAGAVTAPGRGSASTREVP